MLRRSRVVQDDSADVALNIAVLLQAGIAPDRAWAYVAGLDEGAQSSATRIVQRMDAGERTVDAVAAEGNNWVAIAAAWQVATAVGAPLSAALRSIAGVITDARATASDVQVALAEPAATARLMLWLPALSVFLGWALGFNTVGVLLTTPIGWVCLVIGFGLILIARRWTERMVRSAQRQRVMPGLREELLAIALTGGASPQRARQLVDDVELIELAPASSAERMLTLSAEAGVPAAELLRASATSAQHAARTAGRLAAARLSTSLLIPIGVCTLPAFFVLGVLPMMFSVVSSVELGI